MYQFTKTTLLNEIYKKTVSFPLLFMISLISKSVDNGLVFYYHVNGKDLLYFYRSVYY